MATLISEEPYYRHQPLPDNRSIRVLHLQPASNRAAPIQCRIETVSLDQPPIYFALSYSWDAQTPSEPISILLSAFHNDLHPQCRLLKVTANCAAAMRRLRHPVEARTIWIDSICIDQTSLAERSSQVALMCEIFRKASLVVVWLGEGDKDSAISIKILSRIGDTGIWRSLSNNELKQTDCTDLTLALSRSRAEELLNIEFKRENIDKIGAIFCRSWFTRMWTIQEALFPSVENIVVLCGDDLITWASLSVAMDNLREVESIDYSWGDWQRVMRIQHALMAVMSIHRYPWIRYAYCRGPPQRTCCNEIWAIMSYCRRRLASDPKDKALALYGFLSELGVKLPRPDYAKSVGDIYAETTAACIDHDGNLRILYQAPSDTRRPGLPSWVPDWSDTGWEELDARYANWSGPFAASGSSDPLWTFSPNRRRLIVHGKIIDTIVHRAGSYSMGPPHFFERYMRDMRDSHDRESSALWGERGMHIFYETYQRFKEWVYISNLAMAYYPTGEPMGDVLRRTLINDEPTMQDSEETHSFWGWLTVMRLSDEQLGHELASYLSSLNGGDGGGLFARLTRRVVCALGRELIPLMFQNPGVVWDDALMLDLKKAALIAALIRWNGLLFHMLASTQCHHKAFIRTSRWFLGTVPDRMVETIQNGDLIAVIAGLNMPVVLRPDHNGGFRLITHCYVHGIMYGEAWDRVQHHLDEIVLV